MSELTAAELLTAPTEVEIAEVLTGLSGPAEYQYAHKIVRRMAMQINRLTQGYASLLRENARQRVDIDLLEERCDDKTTSLEAFQQFDGDDDLWAALKQDRDAALATAARYERIATVAAERCRSERGQCWCGCHVTEMIDETKVLANRGPTE